MIRPKLYVDGIDADAEADRFIHEVAAKFPFLPGRRIEFHNDSGEGSRTCVLWASARLLAITVTVRNEHNWTLLVCTEIDDTHEPIAPPPHS